MTENERYEIEKILKQMEDDEKTMKRIERPLFIVVILMVISLGGMIYLTCL